MKDDAYACKEWCKKTPDCGGFNYFPTAVTHESPDGSIVYFASFGECHLKPYYDTFTYSTDRANEDTISGELIDCIKRGTIQ